MTHAEEGIGPARFPRPDDCVRQDSVGRNIDIPSASPLNYHQVISKLPDMPPVTIDGKLFLPASVAAPARKNCRWS